MHISRLESEIHKVRLGLQGLQNTGVLMNEQSIRVDSAVTSVQQRCRSA